MTRQSDIIEKIVNIQLRSEVVGWLWSYKVKNMEVFESSGALQVSQICRIRSGTLRWRIRTVKLFLGVLVMTFPCSTNIKRRHIGPSGGVKNNSYSKMT